jgi:hypothetical protein
MRLSRILTAAALTLVAFAATAPARAQNGTVNVVGTTSIFGANTLGPVSGDNSGTRPTAIALNAGASRLLTFSGITGLVGANATIYIPPDGDVFSNNDANIESYNGIRGVIDNANRQMALYGLFSNGTFGGTGLTGEPKTDFRDAGAIGHSFTTYSPVINQVFFIGDALTGRGSGSPQSFVVPVGATTLYFGFVDGFYSSGVPFVGNPGSYADNTGSFTVNYNVADTSQVPEPGTIAFLAGSFVTAGLAFRRSRTQ